MFKHLSIVLAAATLVGCAGYVPPCTVASREKLVASVAYWEKQPAGFPGYEGAVGNLNYKVNQFNHFCAKKEFA